MINIQELQAGALAEGKFELHKEEEWRKEAMSLFELSKYGSILRLKQKWNELNMKILDQKQYVLPFLANYILVYYN